MNLRLRPQVLLDRCPRNIGQIRLSCLRPFGVIGIDGVRFVAIDSRLVTEHATTVVVSVVTFLALVVMLSDICVISAFAEE